jgi:hypothetical protein
MALVSTKAFVSVDEIGAKGNTAGSKVGGRVDIRKEINEINFVASFTDSTIRGYESAPHLPDALITADKRINDKLSLALGYDAGVKSAFASVTGDSNVSNKDVRATATWFQKGGHVRTEASVNLDGRSSLWGTYTFNDNANLTNSTYINLREREGFVLRPFTVPIATSAIKYSLAKDDYLIEASADLNKQAPYLSVQRRYGRQTYKAHYAFKDEFALLETGFAQTDGDLPLIKGYFKGPLGRRGVGPLSVGLIFDKAFDL